MPLSVGTKLGPYEILAPIGAGGMGEVYKARDTRLDRIVAIKRLKTQHGARFNREARAIGALTHPHICQIYDIGPNYLVMEYVEGNQLAGPLPVDEAVKLALQIAGALEEAHARGILHRDLKPANIVVTPKGAAKLLDFGLAKLTADSDSDVTQTVEGTVLGTAAYMAPEQAEGKPLDERSEVFSFGALLYEMLSGNRAFRGSSTAAALSAVLRDNPAPLQAPVDLQRIVSRCLAKQPQDRFPGMAGVRIALEQVSSKPAGRTPFLAVLPFANLSNDIDHEYFSDGLAEEIINALAQVPGLKVIARTSAFAFKGKNEDIRKIAETLGVNNLLEGSVRRSGNRLRITAQLIHAADGTHLWSHRYDRDMTDVFAIQDEISQAISEALQVRLAPRARAVNIDAYQLFLKGQYHKNRITPESLAKAKDCFERALAIDPHYAPAYGGLAVYYYMLSFLGLEPVGEMAPLVKSAAEKALAIDPANSEAHCALAIIAAVYDYDWKTAEAHYRKAMEPEPAPPLVRYRYASYYLVPLGRFAEAMEQNRLGLETDPLSMVLHFGMCVSMYCARQYRETLEYARRALEIDASLYPIWHMLGLAQLGLGLTEEAITNLKRAAWSWRLWDSQSGWLLAIAYYRAGDLKRSREWARNLTGPHGHSAGDELYYAAAGEVDAMFEAFDAAFERRDFLLSSIQLYPLFDPYRADPRWQALLRRMNLA